MGRITRYELLERIGVGGMAEIYRARAFDGVAERFVCVKKILAHLSEDPEYRQMFMDEARIAFSLHHPNIVQMLDLGRIDDHLFLALEFVDGADLHEVLMRARDLARPLPLETSLHIALEVLKGLHYAHSRRAPDGTAMGIVHRDVSPGNVLVSREGTVKLGDFGIARAAVRAGRTVAGVVKGNALYMAPEQITGQTMDARTDVYGAGLLLLTLLCGRHPLEREPLPKLIDFGVNADVPDPSAVNPSVPKELDIIVARATELDPGVRYQTAREFGMAIENFAQGKGIALSPERAAKSLAALFPPRRPDPPRGERILTYAGPIEPLEPSEPGTPVESLYRTYVGPLEKIDDPPRPAPTKPIAEIPDRTRLSAADDLGPRTRLSVSPPLDEAPTNETAPDEGARILNPSTAPEIARDAVTRTQIPQLGATAKPSKLRLAVPAPTPRGRSTTAIAEDTHPSAENARPLAPEALLASIDPVTRENSLVLGVHRQAVASVGFAGMGTAVSVGFDQMLRVWDIAETHEVRGFRAHSAAIIAVAVSRDGTFALTASRDKSLRLWDLASGAMRRTLSDHEGWVFAASISADGKRFVSGGQDRTLRVWDAEGNCTAVLTGHSDTVVSALISSDGRRALSGSYDRTVRLWDVDAKKVIRVLDAGESVRAVALLPDGRRALSAGADRRVTLWDVERGEVIRRMLGHLEPVVALAVSPDGTRALSGSYDTTLRMWDVETGEPLLLLKGHSDPVTSVAFHPDGARALSGSADGTLRLWRL